MRLFSLIADYLRSDRFFPGWTREALEDYVRFHVEQSTLCFAARDHRITGVLVGWQQRGPAHIPFNWQRTDPRGNWWWWDQFKASDADSALVVGQAFIRSQPLCLGLPGAGMRHGKLRIYPAGMPLRTFMKGTHLYGNKCPSTR